MEYNVKYFVTFSSEGRFTAENKKELKLQVEEYVCSQIENLFQDFSLEEIATDIVEELPF